MVPLFLCQAECAAAAIRSCGGRRTTILAAVVHVYGGRRTSVVSLALPAWAYAIWGTNRYMGRVPNCCVFRRMRVRQSTNQRVACAPPAVGVLKNCERVLFCLPPSRVFPEASARPAPFTSSG